MSLVNTVILWEVEFLCEYRNRVDTAFPVFVAFFTAHARKREYLWTLGRNVVTPIRSGAGYLLSDVDQSEIAHVFDHASLRIYFQRPRDLYPAYLRTIIRFVYSFATYIAQDDINVIRVIRQNSLLPCVKGHTAFSASAKSRDLRIGSDCIFRIPIPVCLFTNHYTTFIELYDND